MRRPGNEHLSFAFAAEWPTYELDEKTRTLLAYTAKLTETPSMVDDADIDALRTGGWDEHGIWQATALISFFNCTGRMEAAAGLPPDQVPLSTRLAEAKADGRGSAGLLKRQGETP